MIEFQNSNQTRHQQNISVSTAYQQSIGMSMNEGSNHSKKHAKIGTKTRGPDQFVVIGILFIR